MDAERIVAEMKSEFCEVILRRIESMESETRRFLYFIAWMNTMLERRNLGRIILVGGFAVEVLTGSTYRTLDVDIIVEGSAAKLVVQKFLERISELCGRTYLPRVPALGSKGIDIVGTVYAKRKRPIKLFVNEEYVYVVPPEELIVTYLCSWKFWGSVSDRDRVYILLNILWDKIDREYVIERAEEEGVRDFLKTALKDLKLVDVK